MLKPSPTVGNRRVTDGGTAAVEAREGRRGRSAGATRQAEHRQRERDGVHCYYVPVDHAVIEALIDRGLAPEAALDPKAVGRELGEVLEQWAARWQREKNFP
jgi:hypothetical protein